MSAGLSLVAGEGFVLGEQRISPQQAAAHQDKLQKRAREVRLHFHRGGEPGIRWTEVGHREYIACLGGNGSPHDGQWRVEESWEGQPIRDVGYADNLADVRILIAAHALEL